MSMNIKAESAAKSASFQPAAEAGLHAAQDDSSVAVEHVVRSVFSILPMQTVTKTDREYSKLESTELLEGVRVIELKTILGEGTFGIVYRGIVQRDRENEEIEVAVKVNKTEEDDEGNREVIESFKKEIHLLQQISLANRDDLYPFVRFIAARELDHSRFCLVLELCDCTLKRAWESNLLSTAQVIRDVAHQLIKGLHFLQHNRIVHCDFTPINILVQRVSGSDKLKVRISDFGAAQNSPYEPKFGGYYVQRWYRAPELIFGLPVTIELDWWSLGCTLYEVVTRRPLFPADNSQILLSMHYELLGGVQEDFVQKVPNKSAIFDDFSDDEGFHKIRESNEVATGFVNRKIEWDMQKMARHAWENGSVDDHRIKRAIFQIVCQLIQWNPNDRKTPGDLLKNPIFAI